MTAHAGGTVEESTIWAAFAAVTFLLAVIISLYWWIGLLSAPHESEILFSWAWGCATAGAVGLYRDQIVYYLSFGRARLPAGGDDER